jgi:hypothetical protein
MSVQRVPIATELGHLRGRDCIYLDSVAFDQAATTLTLAGDINTAICSPPLSGAFVPYELRFLGVSHHDRCPIDSSGWDWEASFEERFGSSQLAQLDPNGDLGLRHFFVQTYDDVFHVLCSSFEFTLLGQPA